MRIARFTAVAVTAIGAVTLWRLATSRPPTPPTPPIAGAGDREPRVPFPVGPAGAIALDLPQGA